MIGKFLSMVRTGVLARTRGHLCVLVRTGVVQVRTLDLGPWTLEKQWSSGECWGSPS